MWVVKLGGSLADSPHLPRWLEALAETGAIIVPGGGPFADQVRTVQTRWQFDELTAHHMAILGMRQYGRMLLGLCPRLQQADRPAALAAPAGCGGVWLPMPEQLDAAGIPATWRITADSLAAWLALEVGASDLLLIKSVMLHAQIRELPASLSCGQAVNKQWVDPVFEEYGAGGRFSSWLCGPGDHAGLSQSLADPASRFIRIEFP